MAKERKGVLTPDGSPMDYKVEKLKKRKPEDKIKEELKKKAEKKPTKKAGK